MIDGEYISRGERLKAIAAECYAIIARLPSICADRSRLNAYIDAMQDWDTAQVKAPEMISRRDLEIILRAIAMMADSDETRKIRQGIIALEEYSKVKIFLGKED